MSQPVGPKASWSFLGPSKRAGQQPWRRWRRTDLLHAVETLLQQLDLNIWAVCLTERLVLVQPTVSNLFFPQKLNLVLVRVQLPTQGVVLLLQSLFINSWSGTNRCYDSSPQDSG